MKIVFIISNSMQGGAQKHLRDMFRTLLGLGHDIYLIAPRGWLVDELKDTPDRLFITGLSCFTTGRVRNMLDEIQPDIVNTFILSGGIYGYLAWKKKKYGHIFITVNNPIIYDGIKPINRFLYPRFYRWLARGCSGFLVKSDKVRDEVRQVIRNRVPTMSVINGIDFTIFDRKQTYPDLRYEWNIPRDGFIVSSVGALEVRKGHCYLIEAIARLAAEHQNIYCCLVGSGSEEANLRANVARLGVGDRVLLLGNRADINAVLSNSDAFVLPSLHEGLPNALLEAMAMGLPCVATDVGGVRELLPDAGLGSVVPPRSAEAIYRELNRYLADPELRRSTGERACEKIKAEYSLKAATENLLSVYRQCMAGDP
ncbi:Alpha-D-kanosaminyltransferase [Sporotomaculum syntrophicum]|uniref:Alpha-D-kanosaminyltransferase n=1 Tax=Sporotomaculum syntrophicum TaxID=182264 RepID=A0A9D2WSH0_9FIRM|nr:glycosyltransferase [Sporotomaculum syntrophicum]KAF1086091.1 Alpha-D-kanosaminyltransferase [Sporotomaculum syntrophicum]